MSKDYYLVHHGILGQKWGVRRFQNEDGSYTTEGRIRYGIGEERAKYKERTKEIKDKYRSANENILTDREKKRKKELESLGSYAFNFQKAELNRYNKKIRDGMVKNYIDRNKELRDAKADYKKTDEYKLKRAITVGAAIGGTALAIYGGVKIGSFLNDQKNLMSLVENKKLLENLLIPQLETNIKSGKVSGDLLKSYSQGLEKHYKELEAIKNNIDEISKKHLYNFGLTTSRQDYEKAINMVRQVSQETASTIGRGVATTGKILVDVLTEVLKAAVS